MNFKRTLLINISVAVAGIGVLAGVIGWFASDIEMQATIINKDRTLARERSASIAVLAELKSNAAKALRYEQKLNAFLPTQEQLLDFPRTLDNLARVRRLALSFSFRGGQGVPEGVKPGSVGFTLSATGALSDVLNFMKDIEISPTRFLATLSSADLTRIGEGEYRLSAQGAVFFGK
ncbi:MAG: hypothetical protein NUV53_01285 [Patescibacteria group bacterium]|nr:hypothetical protein [Patescibacteria group bacterium]